MSDALAALKALLNAAQRVAIFTGAGISTESGVPDFRSPGGIWSRLTPIDFKDFIRSEDMRRESWRRKIEIDRDMQVAEPNRGHRAVAELLRRGQAQAVMTQNIDGLHQRSGIPDHAMIELHGNGTYASCLDCSKRYELAPIVEAFTRDDRLPHCDACGGLIKSATISFGQSMPEAAMRRAEAEALACDLFLVLGSSLMVYPAAGFPRLARRNGAKLVIVNREETDQDRLADLVLRTDIGPTLGEAIGVD
jgi:NAD-dependent deacetylase